MKHEFPPLPDNKVMIHGFNVERFNAFLGKLLTLADTLGLPQAQSEAYKSLIKQEVWNLWEHAPFIEEKEWNVSPTNN
ncbi:MAG: hypothetical protein AAB403_13105 [Planctomycetota bacterium]